MYIREVIPSKAAISKGILLFDISMSCFPWFSILKCSTHILWFGFVLLALADFLWYSCFIFFLQLLLKVKLQASDWNPLSSLCAKNQSPNSTWDLCWLQLAVSKCMGPGHLCVRPTLHSVCRNELASDTSFPYLRISFREGNTERQKVPEAVCTQWVWFFWLQTQRKNLHELPSVEGMLTLMAPAQHPGKEDAVQHLSIMLHWAFAPALWPHAPCKAGWGTLICHPCCGAGPPTARAWESSQDNYSWPV